MLTEKNTSDKYKYCEFCGRTLPKHYEGTLCPTCQEAQLFRNVRDYIRANTVNEYEVAEHFHIPLRQIKEWIREGRIEYHEVDTASTISGMHCQRCGAPVSFGTLCPNCLKLMNTQGRSVAPPFHRIHACTISIPLLTKRNKNYPLTGKGCRISAPLFLTPVYFCELLYVCI